MGPNWQSLYRPFWSVYPIDIDQSLYFLYPKKGLSLLTTMVLLNHIYQCVCSCVCVLVCMSALGLVAFECVLSLWRIKLSLNWRINIWMDGCIDTWMYILMESWLDSWRAGLTNKWSDKNIDSGLHRGVYYRIGSRITALMQCQMERYIF